MASLKNIKLKIQSYKKTGTVTHAMEAVSAVKMRKSQERALSGRSYAAAALSVLEKLSGTADASRHPLTQERAGKVCIVVVTSDKGLAGSLNSGVIRKAENFLSNLENVETPVSNSGLTISHKKNMLAPERVVIVGIGRRGADYFANRGYEVRIRAENVSDDVSEATLREVTNKIFEWHASGEIGAVYVAYQNFISTFEQHPSIRQILPIKPEMVRETIAGIRPARGKYAPQHAEVLAAPATYTIEPDADTVLTLLLPRLLNIALFHTLLEGKASEHSARMVAMKSATDKAKDMAKNLTRTFNRIRQASITREVSEITSGMEAMK
jgi:F-type H+-transporting ATPase subunit gamma